MRTSLRPLRACALFTLLALGGAALPTVASALPQGRVYEMVTPVYKGGYGVGRLQGVAPDGEAVAYPSYGGFAGLLAPGANASNYYLARRGPSGWSTVSLEPPFGAWADVSTDLTYALGSGPIGPNTGVANHSATEQVFQLHSTKAPELPETWEPFGGIVLTPVGGGQASASSLGGSPDLCHLVLESPVLLAEAVNTAQTLYDFSRGCGHEPPSLRLVALNNSSTPTVINHACKAELGSGHEYVKTSGAADSNFDAIAADGGEIFFTSSTIDDKSDCIGAFQVYVRLGGSKTLEVSKPLEPPPFEACSEVPCAGAAERPYATFVGAAEDGSRVFFTTTAQLTASDEDTVSDLYMAGIACPGGEAERCEVAGKRVTSLVQVSQDPVPGQTAEVQGAVKLSRDGSHAYFVARGVLSEGSNAQGQAPVKGADNFYVYDAASGKSTFLADLCSGPGFSGNVRDIRCPSDLDAENSFESSNSNNDLGLWASSFPYFPEAQTNSCPESSPGCEAGRFLVFSTYGQLVPGDTDSAKDVYRYDAVTEALDRVSLGEEGHDANGNSDAFNATIQFGHMGSTNSVKEQYELDTRAISEDGSRIVFSTVGPLSSAAGNGHLNVYEWHEAPGESKGHVSIVSTGAAEEDDTNAVISASGRDVFFNTAQGLVSQDTDGARDIYDARLEGGFPPPPAPRQSCSGDACQGPLTNPAPLLVPGTVSQSSGENWPPPPALRPAIKRVVKPTVRCAKAKKLSRGRCLKVKKKARRVVRKTNRRSSR